MPYLINPKWCCQMMNMLLWPTSPGGCGRTPLSTSWATVWARLQNHYIQWFVVWVQLRNNFCCFHPVSHTISPDTKPEVPGQRSHCLILRHFCCPMMLHQLERRSELENTFLLAWRFEEVHLSINSGDSKEEVYGCLLRSEDLPHLRKTLTWRDIRLLNLGGRKRVQHSDRSANGEGT